MLKSSATSSRASMLAAVSGLCREKRSETSILANPSDEGGLVEAVLLTIVEKVWAEEEEEEGASRLTSPALEEDSGRQHEEEEEVVGWWGGSAGCGSGGGGGGSDGCCFAGAETVEEALFTLFSLAESLQAHWHWQDSSCLMMMTGRLRPICWTELPETSRRMQSI